MSDKGNQAAVDKRNREIRQRMINDGRWLGAANGAPKPTGTSDDEWFATRHYEEAGNAPKEGESVSLGSLYFVVIHSYGLDEAIADGMLVPFEPESWATITGGKPIVVTAAIREAFSDEQIKTIWDQFVHWIHHVKNTLPEEDQLFQAVEGGQKVWVLEDGASFTILRPEDY